jgi:hypothetical protein
MAQDRSLIAVFDEWEAVGRVLADLGPEKIGRAGALRGWMSSEQAREVQWHVEKGRIVLWLEPPTSEDVDTACARLVQASPHLVELCNVDYNP